MKEVLNNFVFVVLLCNKLTESYVLDYPNNQQEIGKTSFKQPDFMKTLEKLSDKFPGRELELQMEINNAINPLKQIDYWRSNSYQRIRPSKLFRNKTKMQRPTRPTITNKKNSTKTESDTGPTATKKTTTGPRTTSTTTPKTITTTLHIVKSSKTISTSPLPITRKRHNFKIEFGGTTRTVDLSSNEVFRISSEFVKHQVMEKQQTTIPKDKGDENFLNGDEPASDSFSDGKIPRNPIKINDQKYIDDDFDILDSLYRRVSPLQHVTTTENNSFKGLEWLSFMGSK